MVLGRHSSTTQPLLTTTVTSPPYGALKNYGHPDQIGWGQRPDEYLVDVRRVLETLFRHTKRDGSLWLVVDTIRPRKSKGLWNLRMLPFELASEAETAGWALRDVIIWQKDKSLPWSSRGRLRNSFEYVLFFVKTEQFKYRVERLRDPSELKRWWVKYPERYNPEGKVPSNIWYAPIPVQGSWRNTAIQHACPLPPDLVERMLLLSTDENDVVLDPFAGSGVVVAEAERLGRRGVGLELVESHVHSYFSTVRPEILRRRANDVVAGRMHDGAALRETILNLRTVKFPKSLMMSIRRAHPTLEEPVVAIVIRRKLGRVTSRHQLIHADVFFGFPTDHGSEEYAAAARAAWARKPASKFGVAGEVAVVGIPELGRLFRGRTMHLYEQGRTHQSSGTVRYAELVARLQEAGELPLVASNVCVFEEPREISPRRADVATSADRTEVGVHAGEPLAVDNLLTG